MDLNKYRVDMSFCYEQASASGRKDGYEIVFAGSPESAKLVAKARALQSFRKQGVKIVFLDLKDPVLVA